MTARREEQEQARLRNEKQAAEKAQLEVELLGRWPSVHAAALSASERAEAAASRKEFGEALRIARDAKVVLDPYAALAQTTAPAAAVARRLESVAAVARAYVEAPRYAQDAIAAVNTSAADNIIAYHKRLQAHFHVLAALSDDVRRLVPQVRVAEQTVQRRLKATDRDYRLQVLLEERYARLQQVLKDRCGPSVDSAGEYIEQGAMQRAICRRDTELDFERRNPLPRR